jgi:hypothetical protein
MLGKTRMVKYLCILTLLVLPIIFVSILSLVLLFNQISLLLETLEDESYYLIVSLLCLFFIPLPPPSKRKLKSLKNILASRFRKFVQTKAPENFTIKNNLDVHTIPDAALEELTLELELDFTNTQPRSKNSSSPSSKPSAYSVILNSLKVRLKKLRKHSYALANSISRFCSSLLSHFRKFGLRFLLTLGGGFKKLFTSKLSYFLMCGDLP